MTVEKILKRYGRWIDGSDYSLTREPFDTETAERAINQLIQERVNEALKKHSDFLEALSKEPLAFSDEPQYLADLHTPEGRELYRKELKSKGTKQ